MRLDPMKKVAFQEYLEYTLSQKKPLSFQQFNRHCGVSRSQWDDFKISNMDIDDIQWSF